jgi:hypothetical protein
MPALLVDYLFWVSRAEAEDPRLPFHDLSKVFIVLYKIIYR